MTKKRIIYIRLTIALVVGFVFFLIINEYGNDLQRLDDIYDTTFDPVILDEMDTVRAWTWVYWVMSFEIIATLFGVLELFLDKNKRIAPKWKVIFSIAVILTIIVSCVSLLITKNSNADFIIFPLNIPFLFFLIYCQYKFASNREVSE